MTIRFHAGMAAALLATAIAGCAVKRPNQVCEPSQVVDCVGPEGCAGRQTCRQDGTGYYHDCTCVGDEKVCIPGEAAACRDADQCAGQQVCNADGLAWGACTCLPDDVVEPVDAPMPEGDPDDAAPPGDAYDVTQVDLPPADLPPADLPPDARPDDGGDLPADLPDIARPDEGGDLPADLPDETPPADLPPEAGDTSPELPPYEEPAARVLYDFFVSPIEGFFPWDRHLDKDGAILVDADNRSNANLPLLTDGPYPGFLQAVHGFATYSPIVFQTSGPLDPTSLPATLADSTAADASVRLHVLAADGTIGERVAFGTEYLPYTVEGYFVVRLIPAWPLRDKRYLLLVTDGIRAEDGTPLKRSRGFAQVLGQAPLPTGAAPGRAALVRAEGDLLVPLLAAQPDADHVLAAATFTTALAYSDALGLERVMARFAPPSLPPAVPYDLDLDDDGQPDIVYDGRLADCSMDAADMGWAVKGTFNPWNLTDPVTGLWVPDGDGFVEFASEDVDFRFMVPAGPGPFPVVVAQHGIASDLGAMCQISRMLVKEGIAVLRFDFPLHGSRGHGDDAYQWGFEFLSVIEPLKCRDNFRQAALDIASAILLVDELAQVQDGWPRGAPDGTTELDTAHIAFQGHSLGSIIGMLYLPFSTRIEAFVSNVGGLGMFHLVDLYIEKFLGMSFDSIGYQNTAEHIVWAGDAIAYAERMLTGYFGPEGRKVRLLAQEVIGDDTIANISTEAMARALSLPQVGPVLKAIPGVEAADAPTVESGLMQFQGIRHGDFVGGDEPAAELERRQAVHFLKSWFNTGRAEIITQ